MRCRGQYLGGRGPLLAEMHTPLGTRQHGGVEMRMRQQEVHRIGPKPCGQVRDHAAHSLGVALMRLGIAFGHLRRADQVGGLGKRHRGDPLAGSGFVLDDPALIGTPRAANRRHIDEFGQRAPGVKPQRVVMVAGDDDGLRACAADTAEETEHSPLGRRRRPARVEHIARHYQQIGALVLDKVAEMRQHGFEFIEPVDPFPQSAGMPIAGMDDQHASLRDTGERIRSSTAAAASRWRVPQAGNGKRSRIGVGISGCATIIVPGCSNVARSRATRVRSRTRCAQLRRRRAGRLPSARRWRRPGARLRWLSAARRTGTCQQPAALGNVEQHVADRARSLARRVFVQLVSTIKTNGRPARFFLLHHPLQQHADDEHLRGRVQGMDIDNRELVILPADRAILRLRGTPHEVADILSGGVQATPERIERAGRGLWNHLVECLAIEQVDEVVEGFEPLRIQFDRRVVCWLAFCRPLQHTLDADDDKGELAAIGVGFAEGKAQQPVAGEFPPRP